MFIGSKVCNFLCGWPVCGALAETRIKPRDFAPQCLGSFGELQLFCLLLSGQGPGASSLSTVLLAKQEPGLWDSVGH